MKHLCCSRYIFVMIFLVSTLFAGVHDKSAIFYYGKKISYPMVGIHDYIIVKPENTNNYTHGFDLYKKKMYAVVEMQKYANGGEIDTERLYDEVDSLLQRGFENFMFDASAKSLQSKQIIEVIQSFHQRYTKNKLLLKGEIDLISKLYGYLDGAVLESAKNKDITTLLSYGIDIIDIEYVEARELLDVTDLVEKIKSQDMIPYITTNSMRSYGVSSKNAIKREVLTLIDESKFNRMLLSAHQHGAIALEYNGYIQKLYDINQGLPDIEQMGHYAGVIIWLSQFYEHPVKLIRWVMSLHKIGIKVVFASNFGANVNGMLLKELGIDIEDSEAEANEKKTITYKDKMIGFEIEPSVNEDSIYMQPQDSKALLTYENADGLDSSPVAITPWGGYAISESFMLEMYEQNLWVVNPFDFFEKALRLPKLLVPDTTTQNGNRVMFTHIDGDGIMNYVESNPELFSGDMIYEKILKPYKIPHSVSVIGAEINPDGLYPELSEKLMNVARKMYKLENVEAATHTFTHPFKWGEIKNNSLDKEYRLKVKNYNFSLERELSQTLEEINTQLVPKNRRVAQSVFWSGDCAPRKNALEYIYKHRILNINGGDTVITNAKPWLTNVAPIGLERDEYYQIYTGAQNENVYTNDWLGPFWGFKKVVQTFKLTNSPRRLKPIDVYYHIYSGSKIASLNALKYVFDWSLKQDVMPIFTSAYIPKAMDYFTLSMAKEGDEWLFEGMRDLKTLRKERKNASVNLKDSKSVVGLKHFENHTYISLDNTQKHFIVDSDDLSYKKEPYLISANANVVAYRNGLNHKRMKFEGDVTLKLEFHIPKKCSVTSLPKASKVIESKESITMLYNSAKKATVDVSCR